MVVSEMCTLCLLNNSRNNCLRGGERQVYVLNELQMVVRAAL